jgi:hypothetical protein
MVGVLSLATAGFASPFWSFTGEHITDDSDSDTDLTGSLSNWPMTVSGSSSSEPNCNQLSVPHLSATESPTGCLQVERVLGKRLEGTEKSCPSHVVDAMTHSLACR